jgi:hypothetical protein
LVPFKRWETEKWKVECAMLDVMVVVLIMMMMNEYAFNISA